jgi:salicylate hydroxylase
MSRSAFHVLIIGGGLGGLCLAQGLKKAGISVAVYERDRSSNDRLQGYRIHIESQGNRALHACLPPELFDTYVATAGTGGNGLRIVTEQLKEISFFPAHASNTDPEELDLSVSRITLRQVLLSGLDEIVHFNKTFTHYEEMPDGKITAFFEDGTSATGDVLVAADGGNSRVRKQLLPHAERVETGVVAIMGKLPWTEKTRRDVFVPGRFDGATTILGPEGFGMFAALHELGHQLGEHAGTIGVNEGEALELHPGLLFDNTSDYLFWALIARREKFAFKADPQRMDGPALQKIALERVQGWHPHLERMVRESDPSTIILKLLQTALPITSWQTKRITLVGDAIHSMPPTRGIGGNTALRDAHLLCQKLIAAHNGEQPLLEAIHDYETEMRTYGFAAVRGSLQSMNMMVAQNVFARFLSKMMLRALNVVSSRQRARVQKAG